MLLPKVLIMTVHDDGDGKGCPDAAFMLLVGCVVRPKEMGASEIAGIICVPIFHLLWIVTEVRFIMNACGVILDSVIQQLTYDICESLLAEPSFSREIA